MAVIFNQVQSHTQQHIICIEVGRPHHGYLGHPNYLDKQFLTQKLQSLTMKT
jgi:hypothetical protein